MTQVELDQVGIFEQLKERRVSQSDAARILGLSIRQVQRKLRAFKRDGAKSLAHAARGRPSNNQVSTQLRTQVSSLIAEHYPDFGPTLATEKLSSVHGIALSDETVRQLMVATGLWKPKSKRQEPVHTWRERRAAKGELVQLDGSEHDWFEGRAPRCCLLAFIDDATSTVLWAEFADNESTESLFLATRHYLEAQGRPFSIYTDRGGVYRVNTHNEDGDKRTQFERALEELGIGLIHARSPQAKGRIERLFGTLQDRLVKELRLRGISTVGEANHYLQEEHLPAHNARFAVPPRSDVNLHRDLQGFDLEHILSQAFTRTLTADWCLSYKTRWLQLEKKQPKILTAGERIEVRRYLDSSLHLYLKGVELAFKELPERPAKPLREKQPDLRHLGHKPTTTHPWRRYPPQPQHDISTLVKDDILTLV